MRKLIKSIFGLVLFVVIVCAGAIYLVYNYMYPMQYKEEILKYSSENEIDPYLVYAIINVESGFDPNVTSNAEAKGLMQIMDITADWAREHIELDTLTTDDYFVPDTNIKIGCWYLKKLSTMYDNDVSKIAAAYNAGTGNVNKWIAEGIDFTSDEIPFEETRKYVEKVISNIEVYKVLYGDNYSKEDAINAVSKIVKVAVEKLSNKTNKLIENFNK